MTRRWVLGASVLAIAMTGVASAKIISCPAGRFEMQDAGRGGGPTLTGTFLHLSDDGMVAVEGMCDATRAARRFSSLWHGRFSAKWDACGSARIVRLRGRLDDDCLSLRGLVRTSSGARTTVTAARVPVCGDLLVSPGEDCDDGNDAAGDCCVACRREPGCYVACERTADCAPQAVCERYDDTCRATTGLCKPRYRDQCRAGGTFNVCGCDGNAYPTECDAWAIGVSIQGGDGLNSPVGDRCRCRPDKGINCRNGRFCDMPYRCVGGLRPQLGGICVDPPPDCTGEVASAVCGCDGRTYRNDCERRAARAQKACICTEASATPGARCGSAGPPDYGCDCSLDG